MSGYFSVKSISDIDTSVLFEYRDLLLGDKRGKFVVVDQDGFPYARYIDFSRAKEFAKCIGDA